MLIIALPASFITSGVLNLIQSFDNGDLYCDRCTYDGIRQASVQDLETVNSAVLGSVVCIDSLKFYIHVLLLYHYMYAYVRK